jgi:death-on-curing protein
MSGGVRYLSLRTVAAINERMVAGFGGVAGVRDRGLLESAVAQPMQTFGGADLYPSIVEKAARLAFGIVENHPFVDGNKRTAAACAASFLGINGYAFAPPEGELADVFIGLAAGEIDWIRFRDWMAAFVAPIG